MIRAMSSHNDFAIIISVDGSYLIYFQTEYKFTNSRDQLTDIMRTSFCLLAFAAYACAHAINSEIDWNGVRGEKGLGVIGGDAIPLETALYQVRLFDRPSRCGGALLSDLVVVTAAHCVVGEIASVVSAGDDAAVSDYYIIHPEYNYTSPTQIDNDIALIVMQGILNLDKTKHTPIAPAPADTGDLVGTKALLTGFGKTSPDAVLNNTTPLQGVTLDIISNKECAKFFEPDGNINDNILCTSGKGNVGACTGDAGNPLVQNGVLVGIVSLDGCKPGYPTGYVRISKYADWIEKALAGI